MRRYTNLFLTLIFVTTITSCATVRRELGYALISDQTEIDLGTKLSAQIEAKEKLHPDSRLQTYIQRVAAPLVNQAQQDRGLLLIAEDEAELAGVLAHEIGHIVGRHSANQLAAQFGLEFLAGIALGADPYQLGQMASQLSGARFSRDDERQADQYGVKYTIAAAYEPQGLMRFFAKLKKLEVRRRSDLEKVFASHPPTDERIRHIEKLIEKYGAERGQRHQERFMRETEKLRRVHSK
jgi:predicted Zn-dependent protease